MAELDYLETVAKGPPIVEDEQAERSALRARLDAYEDRIEEAEDGAWEIRPALDPRTDRRTIRILRALLGLLMAPLVVTGYAGLAALILPIVVLRSAFGDSGRRQWRIGVRAPATGSLPRRRSDPFPATA